MRLSLIPAALVAGATLASASPLRVVEVITIDQVNGPVPAPFRFGHAAHQANIDLVAEMMKTSSSGGVRVSGGGGRGGRGKKPCNGMGRSRSSAIRAKALEWSNALRQALGLPVIVEAHPFPSHPAHPHFVEHIPPINHVHDSDNGGKKKIGEEQEFHILPFMPPVPPPPTRLSVDDDINNLPHPRPHRIHHHHGHPHSYITRFDKAPFVDRLLIAIGMLGKWEGRAVAFVFGAGLGVLLRMFYVLTIVAFRTMTMKRSNRPTEGEEQHYVIFVEELEQEAEPTTPAPPRYIMDEKTPVTAEN